MPGFASLAMVSLDCEEPAKLAEFYHQVLGWEIAHSQDEYAMLGNPDGSAPIGFGRVDNYQPPRWPDTDTPKQFHLDFYVEDLDKAEARCLELGATKPDSQPEPGRWRILIDPAGHPFDICLKSEVQD